MSRSSSGRSRFATRRELQGLTQVQAYRRHAGLADQSIPGSQGSGEALRRRCQRRGRGRRGHHSGPLVDYKAKGYTLDYLGTEDVDGTDAHKLRVTRPNGDVIYVYLDPDYFLEIRTSTAASSTVFQTRRSPITATTRRSTGVFLPLAQESGAQRLHRPAESTVSTMRKPTSTTDEGLFHFPAARVGGATPAK